MCTRGQTNRGRRRYVRKLPSSKAVDIRMLRYRVVIEVGSSDGCRVDDRSNLHKSEHRAEPYWHHSFHGVAGDIDVANLTPGTARITGSQSPSSKLARSHHCQTKSLRIRRGLRQRCSYWPECIATSANQKENNYRQSEGGQPSKLHPYSQMYLVHCSDCK